MRNRFRAACLIGAALTFGACGSSGEGTAEQSTGEQHDGTTTIAVGATTAAVEAAPTTVAASTTTAAPEPDAGVIRGAKTFDRYRTLVPSRQAIHCALAFELDPGAVRSMPKELVLGDVFDLYLEARKQDSDEADAAYREATEEVSSADFEPRLRKIRAGLKILDATTDDEGARATFAETLIEVDGLLAEIDAGEATVDLAPYLRIGLDRGSGAYQMDLACPFTGSGLNTLASAMSNFAGTNERFGGRGPEARSRCHIAAAIDLSLESTAAGEETSELVGLAFDMFELQWSDRAADQAALDVATSWRTGQEAGDDPNTLAADVLDEWLSYRDGAPEGFILCPLDRGWEA